MRIPDRFLEHRVDVTRRREVGTSTGSAFDPTEEGVHVIVVSKSKLVRDERADSTTSGQEILADTHVLLQPEDFAPPGSKILVGKGTARERVGIVVATALAEHSIAPSSAQAWLV